MFPVGSPLAEGRDKRDGTLQANRAEKLGGRPNRRYRYGARAFSTREGYASRNRETELAFPPERQGGNVRPPSRFSSEMGRVTDAKLQMGFCAFGRWLMLSSKSQNAPKGSRGCGNERVQGFT